MTKLWQSFVIDRQVNAPSAEVFSDAGRGRT
jgi:hypothetical protein